MKAKTLSKAVKYVVAAGLFAGSMAASAYEAGDFFVRAGAANVNPDAKSTNLVLDGAVIGGSSADVKDSTQLGLTLNYMLTNNLGLEVLAATPFKHNITANTGDLDLGVVPAGNARHLPPTLSVVYYPMDSGATFQPYFGLGVNYTKFFKEEVSGTLQSVLGPGSLKLDDSWGLAAQIGADYKLNDNWHLNLAVRYIDIETDATFSFDGGNVLTTNVKIDPIVTMLSVGYKF